MNQVIYSQLLVETVGVTSHNLIKQYKDDKNGYGAWNALCEWYDENSVKNKTENCLRSSCKSTFLHRSPTQKST